MYTLIRTLPLSQLLRTQLPAFAISLVIAEIFYKFHSFLLETAAFLATWFVIDYLISTVAQLLKAQSRREDTDDEATPKIQSG